MTEADPKLCAIGEALYEKLCASDAWLPEFQTYQEHIMKCKECQCVLGLTSEEIQTIVNEDGVL